MTGTVTQEAPWKGVTDDDKPLIGYSVIAGRPDLAYLADAKAGRPATPEELARYEELRADPEWAADNGDPYGILLPPAPAAAPAPPALALPFPAVPQPPVAGIAADAAQLAAREALDRWAGKQDPDATQVFTPDQELTQTAAAVTDIREDQ